MSDEELAKDIGPLAALTIGVGTMIGAGIFVLPRAAISQAGSFAIVAFTLGGAIALLTAFSASELGTAMPKSGGAYYYVNHALGPMFGSVAGWANWLGLAFASAFYMVGFGQYIQQIFGLTATVGVGPVALDPVKLIALAGALLFITVNYVGAKETGRLQNVIVIILVAILTVFTIYGGLRADPANLPPTAGFSDTMAVTGIIFVSYLGFVQITSVAEEIQDPGVNLPRAVIGSVLLVTVIYALVLLTMAAAVEPGFIEALPTEQIAVVEVARILLGPIGAIAMLLGGLLATASSANASILASSRINFAMGRDGIVSESLNEIHPRFATPYRSIAVTGGLILVFIAAGTVETLASMGSVLHLIIYGLLNIGLIVMREAEPAEYDPDYTVPLYPVVPILGALTSLGLIVFLAPVAIGLSAVLVAGAVLWYFVYARSRATKQGILSQYILSRSEAMPDAAVSAATGVQPDGGNYRVMVPLANPENESDLITLASAIAKQRGGTVVATHIVTVPDQTALAGAAERSDEIDETSQHLLDRAREDAETFGVDIETHTIISHKSFEGIFDAAKSHTADLVVMGWGPDSHGSPGRAESAIDELTESVPCDFLVMRDRGFDPSRILLPTAGGPDSDLTASVAKLLQAEYGSEVTLLNVADDGERDDAEQFLETWAEGHGLEDSTLRIETGDVETAIERAAEDATLLLIGATEEGLLRRLVGGSLVLDVVDDVECTVVLGEKHRHRGLLDRLF
ncbi:amino acid transporter [Haloarcula mannanilytica]|uniref:Amino acid transporter n=1 Tax=Haloarcula mannanilytica TaxID=2509225 RepID=A0A4C2EF66_9EURY|nr:amino acid permease [Haloarcula mannanilytica]GCF13161.1 amino acid transporter [Haloarcula mannanilytica]